MTSYYLSYGEPPVRRFPWRLLLAIGSLLLLATAIIGVLWFALANGSDTAGASSAPETTSFAHAIPAAYASDTNTLYLVDVSGSIVESGYLQDLKIGLSSLALPDAEPVAKNSRAALMSFGGDEKPETVIEFAMLDEDEAQTDWLVKVNGLQATTAGGSFIYDAVDSVRRNFPTASDGGRSNVIVLISDGIDGAVGECRPAPPDYRPGSAGYCVGDSGDPVPCSEMNWSESAPNVLCDAIPSSNDRFVLLERLADDEIVVHTIAYGSPRAHTWLMQVAEATGGTYTVGGGD